MVAVVYSAMSIVPELAICASAASHQQASVAARRAMIVRASDWLLPMSSSSWASSSR
ncbi:MAG: hypothetical protein WDN31_05265 [Hyphomicrobium sp.]